MSNMRIPLSLDWLKPQAPNRSTTFLTLKYVLMAVVCITILFCALFFTAIVAFDVKIEHKKFPNVQPSFVRTWVSILLALGLVINCVGLFGLIKEHFATTLFFAVCSLFTVLGKKDDIYQFLNTVAITAMAFVFSAMIKKANNKLLSENHGPQEI